MQEVKEPDHKNWRSYNIDQFWFSKFQSVAEKANLIVEAVNFARHRQPATKRLPAGPSGKYCRFASARLRHEGTVMDRYEAENMGMGGIVAVGKGS